MCACTCTCVCVCVCVYACVHILTLYMALQALPLHHNGCKILGTSAMAIGTLQWIHALIVHHSCPNVSIGSHVRGPDMAEDRSKFSALLDSIHVDQPDWRALTTLDEAKTFASSGKRCCCGEYVLAVDTCVHELPLAHVDCISTSWCILTAAHNVYLSSYGIVVLINWFWLVCIVVVGYPVLVRPSYVLSGAAMDVAHTPDDLIIMLTQAADVSRLV